MLSMKKELFIEGQGHAVADTAQAPAACSLGRCFLTGKKLEKNSEPDFLKSKPGSSDLRSMLQ